MDVNQDIVYIQSARICVVLSNIPLTLEPEDLLMWQFCLSQELVSVCVIHHFGNLIKNGS